MTSTWNKDDLKFLTDAMDRKFTTTGLDEEEMEFVVGAAEPGAEDKVSGKMDIPEPVQVGANGDMSPEDYKACSTVMAVCTNMVQKTIIEQASQKNIPSTEALKNMDAWVKGFVDFPFPFFTFKDTQHNDYSKQDFSLKTDPDVVEQVVNIKNVPDLKDAVIGALKKSGGELASYSQQDRNFNYFGIITSYTKTEISIRVIKFSMKMKTTDAKSLCVTYQNTELNTSYDTYQLVADKELMIKMQSRMGDQLVDYMADKLLEFIKSFYDQQLANYQEKIRDLLK